MDRKPYPAEKARRRDHPQHAALRAIFLSGLIEAFVLPVIAMTFR
jgi:hypothetical protein